MGGGRHSNCSMLKPFIPLSACGRSSLIRSLTTRVLATTSGVSDVRNSRHYPNWQYAYDMERILEEIVAATQEKDA